MASGIEYLSESFMRLGETVEVTIPVFVKYIDLLGLLFGRKVTNNWLKIHGGILYRKQAYRKAKHNRRRKQHGKKSTSRDIQQ